MNDPVPGLIVGVIMLVACAFVGGCCLGDRVATQDEQAKAIKAGVGSWVADRATGETKFVYGTAGGTK